MQFCKRVHDSSSCVRVYARIPNGHPRDDPRVKVGEDVRVAVGVRVGAVECQLYRDVRGSKSSLLHYFGQWLVQGVVMLDKPVQRVLDTHIAFE